MSRVTKVEQYYKKNASDLGWGEDNPTLDSQRTELLEKYLEGERVLEVGCGYGKYTNFIATLGYESYGVDVVDEFIKSAKKNKPKGFLSGDNKKGIFIKASAEKLPFKDNFFDVVILFDLLEHGDDKRILLEAKRVSKKRIIVIVPKEVDEELSNTGVIFRHYIDKTHLREYTKEKLKDLAFGCSLKITTIFPIHPLNVRTIFMQLFEKTYLVSYFRKMIFKLLVPKKYYTELFAILEK